MDEKLNLLHLPPENFDLIVERLVAMIGIFKAVRLRLTSRAFDTAILHAICVSQVVDIEDPAIKRLPSIMSPRLRGMAIAAQSRLANANSKRYVSVVAKVCQMLESLTDERDEDVLRSWRQSIAESVYVDRQMNPRPGTNIEAQNLLCGAVIIGDLSILRSVAKYQASQSPPADINGRTPDFDQPLILAAAGGRIDIVRYLLDNGARHEPRPIPGPQLLRPGDCDRENMYRPLETLKLGDYDKETASVQQGMLQLIWQNLTALRAAVLNGHEHVVRLLLQPEHRLPTDSPEYLRAIMAAVKVGRLDLIRLLFEALTSKMSDFKHLRYFMFSKAVRSGQREVVRALFDRGVKIGRFVRPSSGTCTPLECASSRGHIHMIRLLLERELDVELGEMGHRMPVLKAAECGQEEIVDLLLRHGADPVQAFYGAAQGGQTHLLRYLLDKYPDLPTRDEGQVGRKALHGALGTGLGCITTLVEAGISLNDGYDNVSDLPLNVAKKNYGLWVVDYLRSLGALETDEELDDSDHVYHVGSITVSERTWEWIGRY